MLGGRSGKRCELVSDTLFLIMLPTQAGLPAKRLDDEA